jgi:hypothetical protein
LQTQLSKRLSKMTKHKQFSSFLMSKTKLNKLNISSLKKVNSTISLSNIKTETV